MKIAVEGCAHGELDKIYEAIQNLEKKDGIKIDLLICCGDFQSTRNAQDLRCMAVPQKYQKICSFYKYYSGEKVAPVLTIFIGGNHEASNYLQELAYGGWVAPQIYYMGYASVINVAGVRIGGLSGIYKGHDYLKGHYEKPPYSEETKRSAYHVRNVEAFRLKQIQQPIDIFLSHDWPRGIYNYGEVKQLLKYKPFFTKEVGDNCLGSKPCEELLHHLKPKYWFSAHLHVKFAALVPHTLENEIKQTTKFLALDKCLPKRQFLQIVDVPHDPEKSIELEYDLEWLTILHMTNHLLSVRKHMQHMPGPGFESRWDFRPTKEEMEFVNRKFDGNLVIPENFTQTVAPFETNSSNDTRQPQAQINPQTMAFCDRLSIDDPMGLLLNSTTDTSFDYSQSQVSTCSTLTGARTPEKQNDTTFISLEDSSFNDDLDDSAELDMMSRKQDSTLSVEQLMSSPCLPRRLSMALPTPQSSDLDEPIKETGDTDCIPTDCLRIHPFPSPKDSDMDEPQSGYEKGSSDTISSRVPFTGSEAISEVCDLQPKMKKFKRRNESMYINSEDDG